MGTNEFSPTNNSNLDLLERIETHELDAQDYILDTLTFPDIDNSIASTETLDLLRTQLQGKETLEGRLSVSESFDHADFSPEAVKNTTIKLAYQIFPKSVLPLLDDVQKAAYVKNLALQDQEGAVVQAADDYIEEEIERARGIVDNMSLIEPPDLEDVMLIAEAWDKTDKDEVVGWILSTAADFINDRHMRNLIDEVIMNAKDTDEPFMDHYLMVASRETPEERKANEIEFRNIGKGVFHCMDIPEYDPYNPGSEEQQEILVSGSMVHHPREAKHQWQIATGQQVTWIPFGSNG